MRTRAVFAVFIAVTACTNVATASSHTNLRLRGIPSVQREEKFNQDWGVSTPPAATTTAPFVSQPPPDPSPSTTTLAATTTGAPATTTTSAPLPDPSPSTTTTAAPATTTTSAPPPDLSPSTTTPANTSSADPSTRPMTTIPVTTDLPLVTAPTNPPLSNDTRDMLNYTNTPEATPPSNALVELTPRNEGTEAPALSRPPSVPRTSPPEGGASTLIVDPSQASVSGSDTSSNETSRYVFNTVVGLMLVLLAFFHYLAIDPSFLAPESPADALAAPNTWELSSFATFMQAVAVVSCANVDAPHTVFVSFTDSFSWVNFIVRGSAYTEKTSAVVATSLLSDLASSHRVLAVGPGSATTYDAFGFIQFALRMNLHEYDLFVRAWTFFFVALMLLSLLVIATAALSKLTGRRATLTYSDSGTYTSMLKEASRRMQGLAIWFITMAVLPLTTVSMYELMRDVTSEAGFGSITGVFALLTLIVVGAGIVAVGYSILHHTEVQLSKYHTKVTFGVLYTSLKFEFRAFCAVTLLVQYATGLLMAGVVVPSTQLVLLAALHAAYVVLVVALRPFSTVLHLVATVVFELVVVGVLSLAYGMAHTTDTDLKLTLAYAVVIAVCAVIALMFVRNLIKLWTFVMRDSSLNDLSSRSKGEVPSFQSTENNRNCGTDTISLNTDSPASECYATLTTPSTTVKLVETTANVR